MKKVILTLAAIWMFFACGTAENKTTFGTEMTIKEGVAFAEILADDESYLGKDIRIDDTIAALCKHKGCWLGIGEGEEMLVVTFLDEAFTIPKDADGKRISIQGVYSAETIEEEHEHEEGHKHADGEVCAKSDPKLRHRFVASSVVIYEK